MEIIAEEDDVFAPFTYDCVFCCSDFRSYLREPFRCRLFLEACNGIGIDIECTHPACLPDVPGCRECEGPFTTPDIDEYIPSTSHLCDARIVHEAGSPALQGEVG